MSRSNRDFDRRAGRWQSMDTLDLDVVRGRATRRFAQRMIAAAVAVILVAGGVRLCLAHIHTAALTHGVAPVPQPTRKVTLLLDPVCKRTFDASKATGYCRIEGQTIYFDRPECQRAFTREPLKYAHVKLRVHVHAAEARTSARTVAVQAPPARPVQKPAAVAPLDDEVPQESVPQEALQEPAPPAAVSARQIQAAPAPAEAAPSAPAEVAPSAPVQNVVAADAPSVNEEFPQGFDQASQEKSASGVGGGQGSPLRR